jgi:hypothetical protein
MTTLLYQYWKNAKPKEVMALSVGIGRCSFKL